MKYPRVLLEHCPEETTKLFVDYYTGSYVPRPKVVPTTEEPQSTQSVGTTAIQTLAALFPLPYTSASSTATPQAPSQDAGASQPGSHDPPPPPTYEVPRPRTAFSSFVDHPERFVVFLEACLQHGNLTGQDKVDVQTTLFEIYLHFAKQKKYDEDDEWYSKAKKLIQDEKVIVPEEYFRDYPKHSFQGSFQS